MSPSVHGPAFRAILCPYHSNRVLDAIYWMVFFTFIKNLTWFVGLLVFRYFLAKEPESQDDIKGNEFALKHLHK